MKNIPHADKGSAMSILSTILHLSISLLLTFSLTMFLSSLNFLYTLSTLKINILKNRRKAAETKQKPTKDIKLCHYQIIFFKKPVECIIMEELSPVFPINKLIVRKRLQIQKNWSKAK